MMIEHRESEVVLMILPMDALASEITERIVHPAHVPLERETQTAEVRRAGNERPGGGFLGNGEDTGKFSVGNVVEFLEKLNRLQILAPAILVRNPFAILA